MKISDSDKSFDPTAIDLPSQKVEHSQDREASGRALNMRRTRRSVLVTGGCALTTVACASLTWMMTKFISGIGLRNRLGPIDLGTPNLYAVGSVTRRDRLTILRDEIGIWVVVAICPHLGCSPQWTQEQFQCPCHGSRFDAEGHYLSGPAQRDLALPSLGLDLRGHLVAYPNRWARPGYRFKI
jgi:nitrite reductase/ring-hydroxylating ferredoxin subunit